MRVEERGREGVCILEIHGSMDEEAHSSLLRDKIHSLAESGSVLVLLDLAACPNIDAAAVGAIVECYSKLSRKKGNLTLLHLPKRIRELLSITKLLTVFDSFDDEDEAVHFLREQE